MNMKKELQLNESLAALGHGKWKRALGCTLLMIGLLMGGMNAWAQSGAPAGLEMSKTFTPDDASQHSGWITLETFVTGTDITSSTSQPNDIVLVLDFSRSMNNSMSTLQTAVQTFCNMMLTDAVNNDVDHRISICSFAGGSEALTGNQAQAAYAGTQLRTGTQSNSYPNYTEDEYRGSLIEIKDGSSMNSDVTSAINTIISNNCKRGTYMQYGLDMAYNVFNSRSEDDKVFTVDGKTYPRGMIVVFFTDGYPGIQYQINTYWRDNDDSGVVEEANAAVAKASSIKSIVVAKHDAEEDASPRIFSIGVFDNADNSCAFITTKTEYSTYNRWAGTGSSGGSYGSYACANGLLHFISSDYDETVNSWQGWTTTEGASAVDNYSGYYYGSSSMSSLQSAFQSIASQSGAEPINMGSSTIIQDIISPSFTLPDDATAADIYVYAPKLTNVTGTEGNYTYTFDDLNDNGTLTLVNGVVTGGTENRLLSSQVVTIGGEDGKTLQITGFDFKAHYCHPIIQQHGGEQVITGCDGRKLVIRFHIEIEEGVWGDGIQTNGEMSVILPNGTQAPIYFDCPIADVLGDVWTEIVTQQPKNYSDDNIDSPEDLAWFISRVNGRINYDKNNTVASNTTLSGTLTADIDMSAHNWVPIGCGYKCNNNNEWLDANGNVVDEPTVKLAYEGVFNGNGHVITGLKNNASKYYKQASGTSSQVVVFPGMFANVKGNGTTTGVVKNVFVLDADFRGKHHNSNFVHHGIIADTLTGGAIYNCEAVGSITCNNDEPAEDMMLIYGGLVGLNDGGTIHSSMAMATLSAYSMGGMVGEMKHDATLANSFTNGVFNYLGDDAPLNSTVDPDGYFRYVGGLVGRNHGVDKVGDEYVESFGTIENCYVRLERVQSFGAQSGDNAIKFGQLVGTNIGSDNLSGTITNCYVPGNVPTPVTVAAVADDASTTFPLYSVTHAPSLIRQGRGNDNMVGGTWTNGVIIGGTPMLILLNNNVGDGQASWKRTTAGDYATSPNGGNINGDYPILEFTDFNCVASTDGIGIDYAATLSEMLHRHNNGKLNENTLLPTADGGYEGESNYDYHVAQDNHKSMSDKIYGGTINLYQNDDVSLSTNSGKDDVADNCTGSNVVVYIDEKVSLLQDESSVIEAYTSQTMTSYSDPVTYDPNTGTWNNTNLTTPEGQRWHFVSSSLEESGFGWTYSVTDQVEHNWDADPCGWTPEVNNDDEAIFPTDMGYVYPSDFYCFFEPEYHWVNFRRNGNSHWHMDSYTTQIDYYYYLNGTQYDAKKDGNETQFIPGKGYLLAIYPQYFPDHHMWLGDDDAKNEQFLQNRGILNNGNVDIPVTYTTDAIIDLDGYKTHLEGYNLLGNPYQSYLDFDAFANAQVNKDLWGASDTYSKTYAVYNPETDSYEQYKSNSSKGSRAAGQYINMHQGFFIQTSQSTTAHFTNDMRSNSGTPNFRGEQPAYPLINFTVTDNEGETDLAVLELNRPENDGAKKLRMGSPAGRIYFRYDNTNLAIYFRNSDKDYQTLNFSAEEDGNFTLSWNTANADFSSLTLVDNITGIKTDMLTHDHYTFEGRVDDYNTRFKIVFGEMNNNEEEPVLEHFAFFDHGNLIVNGIGHFEVVDVMGRVLYAVELTDTQNTVSLPSNVRGVCMLCFTRNNETKVQKMVIQ